MAKFRMDCKRFGFAAVAACALVSGSPSQAALQGLERVAVGFSSPVYVTQAPGDDNRLFVVEQAGLIQVIDLNTGQRQSTPFLDITGFVDNAGGEQGLLGLAFDPDFQTNGRFYVNYTRDPGPGLDRTRIDRYHVADPATSTTANSGTRLSILEFEQDFSNHNGGWIDFSPNDGYLYIASGDGGAGNDPNNRAQNINSLLGKMLRIDPNGDDFPLDGTANYAVPADNPFVGTGSSNTRDAVWSYGLRNPWRNSFDSLTGDLWIGDVGQNAREEINFQPGDSAGGENYGWRLREGDIATPSGGVGGNKPADNVDPIYDYISNGAGLFGGNSTVGGYVYRGPDPDLQGLYFFGDTYPRQLWTFDPAAPDDTVTNIESTLGTNINSLGTFVSFGEDNLGNLYVVDLNGTIFRIVTDTAAPGDLDGDGDIDGVDLSGFFSAFTGPNNGPPSNALTDLDKDRDVDGVDLSAAFSAFTGPIVEAANVPEPATALLMILSGLTLTTRRR